MPFDESHLREALAASYRQTGALGLNELASGNLSCRVEGGMLISATGATQASISADSVVKVTLDGTFEGVRQPSSEWRMHAAIYREHPDAGAVIHTHSDSCVAVSCSRQALPGFHYLVGSFGGDDVPCVPYFTFGTAELGEAAAAALEHRTACLLGSHGMVCRGRNLAEAVLFAHRLEIMARQYLLALRIGEPPVLTEDEWRDFHDKFSSMSYGHGH